MSNKQRLTSGNHAIVICCKLSLTHITTLSQPRIIHHFETFLDGCLVLDTVVSTLDAR